jgi:transposase
MKYLGIDQHKRHLTICARNDQGDIELNRQVKTTWNEVDRFLERMASDSAVEGGYVATVEVCGFNDWLLKRLKHWDCRHAYAIKPPARVRQKTDRRDAAKLSELLWLNRDRIATGLPLVHISEVYQPTAGEQYDRQLTRLRQRTAQQMTRVKNRIRYLIRRHNLDQERPTKGAFTQKATAWLQTVELPRLDRLELNMLLKRYALLAEQLISVKAEIHQRVQRNPQVSLLRTLAKMGEYTALALSAHIGPIERFPRARSLGNFFGLTPGCRNSGDSNRSGNITKAGHPFVRFLLGQLVLQALRQDPQLRVWYRGIKRRRGSKIARVAVMRRLCIAIWHILSKQESYQLSPGKNDKTQQAA